MKDYLWAGFVEGLKGILQYGMEWAFKVAVVVGLVTAGLVIVIRQFR